MALSTLLLQATESKSLEKRVDKLEKTLILQQKEKLTKALNGGNSFNQKSFIPDISLILNGSALSRDIENSTYEGYGIDGFVESTDEIPFNKNRGFNFNYAELGMHSEVGPYFDADAIFHLHPDEFEIEEAYITTKKLPANLQLKAGLFRSGFGRINAIHHHAQGFVAQPLVYEAMLGIEGIKDAGVALSWVAPTDTYIVAGIEALQGSNELSFGYPESNNLYVTYLKTGFDMGESNALLIGASLATGKTQTNQDSKLYGAELTLKHTIDSYSSLSWQNEYLYRDRENQKQAGLYSQLLYDMDSSWEFGGRYDAITKNRDTQPDDLKKYSAIVSYRPFEFSKIRLQYSKDKSKSFGGIRRDENMIALDFLVEIGAHGAHTF
jgi:outer membrane receptor protein involved in Fe transport